MTVDLEHVSELRRGELDPDPFWIAPCPHDAARGVELELVPAVTIEEIPRGTGASRCRRRPRSSHRHCG